MNSESTRISNANFKSFASSAIKLSNIKLFAVSVKPVQFTTNPIYSDSLKPMAVMADNRLLWLWWSYSWPAIIAILFCKIDSVPRFYCSSLKILHHNCVVHKIPRFHITVQFLTKDSYSYKIWGFHGKSWSFGQWHHVVWSVGINNSKEHNANIFYPEYGGSVLLWHVGAYIPNRLHSETNKKRTSPCNSCKICRIWLHWKNFTRQVSFNTWTFKGVHSKLTGKLPKVRNF